MGLLHPLKRGDERVVLAEQDLVVELVVDERADRLLDVPEVDHHAALVELARPHRDLGPAVVPVQVLALALVAQQPVAVAERDDLRHGIAHVGLSYSMCCPPSIGMTAPVMKSVPSTQNRTPLAMSCGSPMRRK